MHNDMEATTEARNEGTETERHYRALYEEARKAHALYQSLLNSSADAIVIYEMSGKTNYVSPAFTQIFGWTLDEVKGIRIPFLPESEKTDTLRIIRDLIDYGTPCHGYETKRYTKDGRLLDISISASRYDDHTGKPAGMLVILRDISEKKRIETKLMQSRRMEAIGALAGGIAHDFNNLMMGILGYATLMLHQINENHEFYQKLKNIEKLVYNGSNLTSQLLGYARQGKYKVMPINLNSVIRQSAQTFARTKKEIVVNLELEDDLLPVEADRSQIEQVLLNLYINAADAMPNGGRIDIRTDNITSRKIPSNCLREKNIEQDDFVCLAIVDHGAGIDRAAIDRIFDPFFAPNDKRPGIGLKLSSAHGIIANHGGFIDVKSEIGKGSTFTLYLPATKQIPAAVPRLDASPALGEGTILLVDDEEVVLDVGQKLLNRLGYTVIEAIDGKTAIQIYKDRQKKIDLIILDVIMPGIGGREILDAIKVINPDAKILLSSGYSLDDRIEEIMKRGCHGFIQKPFTLKQFSLEIAKILTPAKA